METDNPYSPPQASSRREPLTASTVCGLRVRRLTHYPDRLRAYQIKVDGETVSSVDAGETVEFAVSRGPHEVVASIDWCGSTPLDVVVPSEGVVELEVSSNLVGLRMLLAPLFVLFLRDQYLTLTLCGDGAVDG